MSVEDPWALPHLALTAILEPALSDVNRLSAFLKEAWAQAGPGALGWTGATDATMAEIASNDFLTGLLTDPTTHVLAAEDAGEIIGVAVLRHAATAVEELAGIILLERRTGEGVGRSLLMAALERSRTRGAKEVVVRTEASNDRALRFYGHLGFAVEGHGLEEVQGTKVDLITLRRRLE